jgi:DNA-binding MarR family transcriptional regulator
MQHIEETIGYALAQVCKAHRNSVGAELRALELHVGQEMILMQLWEEEGVTQSHLAGQMCVEPPTVTKMLQRMEQQGLIERRPDAVDARISRVYLTKDGRTLQGAVEGCWGRVEARATQGMTAEERMLLRRLLLQVHHNLLDT